MEFTSSWSIARERIRKRKEEIRFIRATGCVKGSFDGHHLRITTKTIVIFFPFFPYRHQPLSSPGFLHPFMIDKGTLNSSMQLREPGSIHRHINVYPTVDPLELIKYDLQSDITFPVDLISYLVVRRRENMLHRTRTLRLSTPLVLAISVACGVTWSIYHHFPIITSVHLFLGYVAGTTTWVVGQWLRILWQKYDSRERRGRTVGLVDEATPQPEIRVSRPGSSRWRWTRTNLRLLGMTGLVLCWTRIGIVPDYSKLSPPSYVQNDSRQQNSTEQGRVFIAANLVDVESIWGGWSSQLLELAAFRKYLLPPARCF